MENELKQTINNEKSNIKELFNATESKNKAAIDNLEFIDTNNKETPEHLRNMNLNCFNIETNSKLVINESDRKLQSIMENDNDNVSDIDIKISNSKYNSFSSVDLKSRKNKSSSNPDSNIKSFHSISTDKDNNINDDGNKIKINNVEIKENETTLMIDDDHFHNDEDKDKIKNNENYYNTNASITNSQIIKDINININDYTLNTANNNTNINSTLINNTIPAAICNRRFSHQTSFTEYVKQKPSINNSNINNLPICNNSNNNYSCYNREDAYHNGRWTQNEHFRFIKGCLLYGNNWKKVK